MNAGKIFLLIAILISLSVKYGNCQKDNVLLKKEYELQELFEIIVKSGDDVEKKNINSDIISLFKEIFKNDESFKHPFDSLKYVGIYKSDDNLLKIYSWNIPYEDNTNDFYGFVQFYVKNKKKYFVKPLVDLTDEEETPENSLLKKMNWKGMLYYNLITPKQDKKNKNYILLGWRADNIMTSKKYIDIISVKSNGEIKFGEKYFKIGRQKAGRIEFEYAHRAVMTLRYDKKAKMIVFDHLSPMEPKYADQRAFYGPDGSYDALKYEKKRWKFLKNVKVINPKEKRKKQDNNMKSY